MIYCFVWIDLYYGYFTIKEKELLSNIRILITLQNLQFIEIFSVYVLTNYTSYEKKWNRYPVFNTRNIGNIPNYYFSVSSYSCIVMLSHPLSVSFCFSLSALYIKHNITMSFPVSRSYNVGYFLVRYMSSYHKNTQFIEYEFCYSQYTDYWKFSHVS